MMYSITANSKANSNAQIAFKQTETSFGITPETAETLPSPADLFLGAFAACVLKNVERFSAFMKFEYSKAEINVSSTRLDKPPRMDEITYALTIFSKDDKLNVKLLKKNIEKFGTIYNTVKLSSTIIGEIKVIKE